jgi:hypothetical protein
MALQIKVLDNPYQERLITLNGNSLFFTISFNHRPGTVGRWFLDIEDRNGLPIMSGVKCLLKQNLVAGNLDLSAILSGGIYCVNTKTSDSGISRDNFGTDKQYQLWYISDAELEAA